MAQVRFPRLGELIDQLVRALAGAKNWKLGETVAYMAERTGYSKAAVYRWRQGRLCPPKEVVADLARLGAGEAELDRVWGEAMLRAARYERQQSQTPYRLLQTLLCPSRTKAWQFGSGSPLGRRGAGWV